MLVSVPVTLAMCHFWKLGWHQTCVGRRESNLQCGIVCLLMKDSWEVNCTYGFLMNASNLILWNLWMKFTLQLPVKLGMGTAIVHRISGDTRAWEAAVSPCLLSSISSRAVIRALPKSFTLSVGITSIATWFTFQLVDWLLYYLQFNSLTLGIAWKLQLMCCIPLPKWMYWW